MLYYLAKHNKYKTHGNAQPDGRPLGGSELRSYFCRMWTKVYQINFACAGVSVVCNAIF